MPDLLDEPRPRRFQLVRREDVSGMSGTGVVAEGIEFRDDMVAYRWLTAPGTTQIADSIHDVTHIHGHNGKTTVRWLDDPDPPGEGKTLGEVYDDRNLLALAFAALADRVDVADEWAGGWHLPDADDADADEWAIVWAETPAGQVSWHVPITQARAGGLPRERLEWDGHTRTEKNARLATLISDE